MKGILFLIILTIIFAVSLFILCITMFLSIDVFFYFYSNIPMSIGLNEIKRSLRISIGVGIIMGIGFGVLYIKENKLK